MVIIILVVFFPAQIHGQYDGIDHDNDFPDRQNEIRYVDNKICERLGLICGRDNRTLRRTRCCKELDAAGRLIRYDCCNPELTG